MQRIVAAAILGLILLSPAVLADTRLRFSAPGDFTAVQTSVASGQWVLLVFADSPATFNFDFDSVGSVTNETVLHPIEHFIVYNPQGYSLVPRTNDVPSGAGFRVKMPLAGRASLFVEADGIQLETGLVAGRIAEKPDGSGINDFVRSEDDSNHVHRYQDPDGDHAVIQYMPRPATSFAFTAKGVRHIEWHGTTVQCSGTDWCPDGGTTHVRKGPGNNDWNVTELHSYEIVRQGVTDVSGSGSFAYGVLGGSELAFALDDGRLRLPLASVQGPCPNCTVPENQTLTVGGDLTLSALRRTGEARLAAGFAGTVSEARLDETAIDPARLLGIGTAIGVGTVALGAVALRLLGLLFTKWSSRDLLDLPRRRQIYEAIAQHPGVGFRELMRITGLAVGTVRHHLNVLLRHGKIVERKQGSTLRFFENHGKYDRTWARLAVLRDATCQAVHDWLAKNPDVPQNVVLAALEEQGISRTATRRRLDRLVGEGLATVQRRGRFKVYRAL